MTNDNQVEEVEELDYILPDDYVEEEETQSDEDVEETEVETLEEEVEETEEVETDEEVEDDNDNTIEESPLSDLEVKFLKENKKLGEFDREELKTFIQKGMNQDRLQEKFESVNEINTQYKELAEMFNMNEKELLDNLKNQYFTSKAEEEGRAVKDVINEYNSNHKDRETLMYERFVKKYNDVDIDKIPQEVLDRVKNGEDLVDAYERNIKDMSISEKDTEISQLKDKITELEKAIKVSKQNKKIKSKSVVKKTSGSDKSDNKDDFLQGLLGDY